MYATKEAIIAKEHQNDIEPTIFYMDIRAFGKGFDQYYERAKHEHGVRYVKSAISRILEDPETKDLEVVYADEDGPLSLNVRHGVLSVGMRPAKEPASSGPGPRHRPQRIWFRQVGPEKPPGHDAGRHLRERRVGIAQRYPRNGDAGIGRACEAASIIAEARGKDLVIPALAGRARRARRPRSRGSASSSATAGST